MATVQTVTTTVDKKIDWKSRVRNWSFWVGLVGVIGGVLLPYFGLAAEDLTTWKGLIDVIVATVQNPFLLFSLALSIMSFLGVLANPTTPGLTDTTNGTTSTVTTGTIENDITEDKEETAKTE